jgi:hypothetical protein
VVAPSCAAAGRLPSAAATSRQARMELTAPETRRP